MQAAGLSSAGAELVHETVMRMKAAMKDCHENDCAYLYITANAAPWQPAPSSEQAIEMQQPHRLRIVRRAGPVISSGVHFVIVQSVLSRLVRGLLSTTSGGLSSIGGHLMLRGICDLPMTVQGCLRG